MDDSEHKIYKVFPGTINGEVTVSGAKNNALRLLAASLLTDSPIYLTNYPSGLLDAQIHVEMLEKLGKKCTVHGNVIKIEKEYDLLSELTWDKRSIRNTLLILGALTARTGFGAVPLPGGCALGERKYDLHVMLLEKMGAKVFQEGNMLCAKAPDGLKAADIFLPIRSTGATENTILCGTLARGTTRLWNPHIRPEILDMIRMLNDMGAEIRVFGQERIEITGKEALVGVTHRVIPDNMEALTWLIGAAITGGNLLIRDFPYEHLEIPLIHLRESGVQFYQGCNELVVRDSRCYPVDIATGPYPGINSDMQPLFGVFATLAHGVSSIIDLRFPGRYGYAEELLKMGAKCEFGEVLKINGQGSLHGAEVVARDLRCGAAMLLAGLVAESGPTIIHDAWQIERGYDHIVEKMRSCGIKIEVSGD